MSTNIEVLEGATKKFLLTCRDEYGNALDLTAYDIYGGAWCGGDEDAVEVQVARGEKAGEAILTLPPGAKAGYSWDYQICIRERATGYEWVVMSGEMTVIRRLVTLRGEALTPPDSRATAVLHPEVLHCEVTLAAWNGDTPSATPEETEELRQILERRLTCRVLHPEFYGVGATSRAIVAECVLILPSPLLLAGVRVPVVADAAPRVLEVAEDDGAGDWIVRGVSGLTTQQVGAECCFEFSEPLSLGVAAVRLRFLGVEGEAKPMPLDYHPEEDFERGWVLTDENESVGGVPAMVWNAGEVTERWETGIESALRTVREVSIGADDNRAPCANVEVSPRTLPDGRLRSLTLRLFGGTHNSASSGRMCAMLCNYNPATDANVWVATSLNDCYVNPSPQASYDLTWYFDDVPVERLQTLHFVFVDAAAVTHTAGDFALPWRSLYLCLTTSGSGGRTHCGGVWRPWVAAARIELRVPTYAPAAHADDETVHLVPLGAGAASIELRGGGGRTRVFFLAAGSSAAIRYTEGGAGIGYEATAADGSVLGRGCISLSALCTAHADDFAPA